MSLQNSSGRFSKKTPRHTNPANYSIPDRQPIDQLIAPILTSEDVLTGNLQNLYISPVASFRNTSYDISWRAKKDLGDHSDYHIRNNTFGTSNPNPILAAEGGQKLLLHQELMYDGLLAGMSFAKSHTYALRFGPQPVISNT